MSRVNSVNLIIVFALTFSPGLLACAAPSTTIPPMQTPTPQRILFLGDSYTIGTGVAFSENWPNQLVDRLNGHGLSVEAPRVIAQNGWTTADLAAGIDKVEQADLQVSYDLVTLLIGVNNQFHGISTDEYRAEFQNLLERAIHFAGDDPERVIIVSIPDWSVTPFAARRDPDEIASQIDAFNTVNRVEAEAAGTHYVDVTTMSRLAASDPNLLAPDDLHPSSKMYAEWVNLILPVAAEILAHR